MYISILKRILIAMLFIGAGSLAYILMFKTEEFRVWAADHLDRNRSTGSEISDLAPRTTYWDPSEAPIWYYRIVGGFAFVIAVLLGAALFFGKE
jgi:hypothetical protein